MAALRFAVVLAACIIGSAWAWPQDPVDTSGGGRADWGQEGGDVSPDGSEEVSIDILPALRLKNTGGIGPRGPGTGAGLCVFTSIAHAAREQNEPNREIWDIQEYMKSQEGGGWPEKVTRVLSARYPGVKYLQDTTGDLDLLRAAIASGRVPGVTYNGTLDPRYNGQRIAHMVNVVHLGAKWAAVLDNNFPSKLIWMPIDSFVRQWKGSKGGGWSVVLLAHGAPPIPRG